MWSRSETRTKLINPAANNSTTTTTNEVSFWRDHGASWIHGIGLMEGGGEGRNPIIRRLLEANKLSSSSPSSSSKEEEDDITFHDKNTVALEQQISPVFVGNPWTRPDTVLVKTNSLAIFRNGTLLIPEESSEVFSKAIQIHYQLQQELSIYVDTMYHRGEGMETIYRNVDQVRSEILRCWKKKKQEENNNNDNDVQEMVEHVFPFFNFLLENWNGISSKDTPVGYLARDPIEMASVKTDEIYSHDGDFEGHHCKVNQGMINVLGSLVSQAKPFVRLNETVQTIKDLQDHVRIETASGLIALADCCICTIPIGCLKANAKTLFEPALSDEKLEAIRSIEAGAYKKVFLTFDRIFWPAHKPLLGFIRDNNNNNSDKDEDAQKDRYEPPSQYLLVNNLWAGKGIPCVEAILCADWGNWAFGKSDEVIKDAIIEFLQDAMALPNNTLQEWCTNCHVTRWEEDPFTLGSYSTFCLGTLERHIEAMLLPEWNGRLVFAGEHTESEHQGSVHGAIMSGERAADKIGEFLCSTLVR